MTTSSPPNGGIPIKHHPQSTNLALGVRLQTHGYRVCRTSPSSAGTRSILVSMLDWWAPPAALHRRDPRPQSTHLVLRGFPAQTPVSGLAGGAQHPAEGRGPHLGAHLTESVLQPLRERLPRRRRTHESHLPGRCMSIDCMWAVYTLYVD